LCWQSVSHRKFCQGIGLIPSSDTRFSRSINFSSGAHSAAYSMHTKNARKIRQFVKTGVSLFMVCVLNVIGCDVTWLCGNNTKTQHQSSLYRSLLARCPRATHKRICIESMLVVSGISYKSFLATGCINRFFNDFYAVTRLSQWIPCL
jgi:hypothetical protein